MHVTHFSTTMMINQFCHHIPGPDKITNEKMMKNSPLLRYRIIDFHGCFC